MQCSGKDSGIVRSPALRNSAGPYHRFVHIMFDERRSYLPSRLHNYPEDDTRRKSISATVYFQVENWSTEYRAPRKVGLRGPGEFSSQRPIQGWICSESVETISSCSSSRHRRFTYSKDEGEWGPWTLHAIQTDCGGLRIRKPCVCSLLDRLTWSKAATGSCLTLFPSQPSPNCPFCSGRTRQARNTT